MVQLTPDECRVLGVLVEKAHTTATQYPMSLNAIVVGCNQKSNRFPVVEFDEDRIVRALEGLRDKKLVVYCDSIGSRVMKYRHECRDALGIGTKELVVLTELLLRGPQTAGEIRTHASRMSPLGSLEELGNLLRYMMGGPERPEALIRLLPPLPGSRAARYVQLLCPDLHPLDAPAGVYADAVAAAAAPGVGERLERMEAELGELRRVVEHLAKALGEEAILK
jgi:hypothetical protein